MNDAPVGIFDSGIGGLTVARAIFHHLPAESTVYYGDTARVPYGPKSPDTVRRYSREILDWLVGEGVKAVVVACNTASAVTVAFAGLGTCSVCSVAGENCIGNSANPAATSSVAVSGAAGTGRFARARGD